jgi:hypothetical protein
MLRFARMLKQPEHRARFWWLLQCAQILSTESRRLRSQETLEQARALNEAHQLEKANTWHSELIRSY